jgi:mediator of RNA polymerase II transcription subunit 14
MAKIGLEGVTFELLKLSRVPADNGVGTKLSIGDRSPMDLARLRMRRQERAAARSKNGQSTPDFAIPASK